MPHAHNVAAGDLKPGDVITGYARQYDGATVISAPVRLDNGKSMDIDVFDAPIPVIRQRPKRVR